LTQNFVFDKEIQYIINKTYNINHDVKFIYVSTHKCSCWNKPLDDVASFLTGIVHTPTYQTNLPNGIAQPGKSEFKMKPRVKQLLTGAIVFSSLGLLLFVIGYATGHWLEADDRFIHHNSFVRLGLWEACFDSWTYYKDYTGKSYNGCWWMFSYEYRPIYQYLNPCKYLLLTNTESLNHIFSLFKLYTCTQVRISRCVFFK